MRAPRPALEAGPVLRVVRLVELLIPVVGLASRQARPPVSRLPAAILVEFRVLEAQRSLAVKVGLANRTWESSGDHCLLLQQFRLTAALLPHRGRESHKALAAV